MRTAEELIRAAEAARAEIDRYSCRVLVCSGTGCIATGSNKIHEIFEDIVKDAPGVELVFSPCGGHDDEKVVGVKKTGCQGFCELGPLVRIQKNGRTIQYVKVQPEDCQEIFDAHQKSGVKFATGFVLRFAPIYRKVKEMLESGEFGDLITIDACENIEPYHGSYIMKNWRRKTSEAGPHILEKCCHDIDLLNWFVGSLASKVAAFGGRDFFLPKNADLNEKYPNHFKETWRDPHAIDTPFTEDTDLMDNTVAIFEYRNGVRVQFQATMANAIAERRMVFRCSLGTIMIELYSSTLTWQTLGSNKQSIIFGGDNHGGGDAYIMKELYEGPMCQEDVLPKCSGNEGLESAVLALAIDKAAQTRQIVDLEPVWQKLNR